MRNCFDARKLTNMTTRFLLFFSLATALLADQVTMKNGDHLSGTIVKYDGKNLILKSEFAGQVTIPWDAVTAITSSEPLNVGLKDGQMLVGVVTTTDSKIMVATKDTGSVAAARDTIAVIRSKDEQAAYDADIDHSRNPRLIDLWAGFLDLGYATTQGNTDTQSFTLNADAIRASPRDKIEAKFTMIDSSSNATGPDVTTANAKRGSLSYNLNINKRWFAFGSVGLESDQFQSLDLRFNPAGGVGYYLINTPKTSFDFQLGASEDREYFNTGLDRSFTEVLFGEEFVHKVSSNTSIHQQLQLFPNVTSAGNLRANFDLSAVTAIKKWFGWQFTVSDRFLTNPIAGRKDNDIIISTGVRVTFANK
jgi:putative salt-induced outer membrane protein YdiY